MADHDARELLNAQVRFVSLVDAGANREPFRILKHRDGDREMINLDQAFVRKSAQPTVVFVGLSSDAPLEQLKAIVEKAGFKVDKQEDAKNGVIFKQIDGAIPSDTRLFKASDEVVFGVSGLGNVQEEVQKGFAGGAWDETDFGSAIAQNGAMPMICIAKNILSDVIGAAMYKAENPGEAAKKVEKAIEAFKSYTLGVINKIPQAAFKLDELVQEFETTRKAAVAAPATEVADDTAAKPAVEAPAADDKKVDETVQKNDDVAAPAADADKKDEPSDDAKADEVQKGAKGSDDELKTLITAMGAQLTALAQKQDDTAADMAAKVESIGKEVAAVASRVVKTEKTLKGSLTGGHGVDSEDLDLKPEPQQRATREASFAFDSSVRPLQ